MPAFCVPTSILSRATRLVAASVIALGFWAQPASATVLFDQTADLTTGSRNSSFLNFLGGSPGNRAAENFVLGSAAQVGVIHWAGVHNNGSGIDDYTFTFYADAAGVPGAVLLETTGSLATPTSVVLPPDQTVTLYSAALAVPFSASAGTTYWLSIFNPDTGASWAWSTNRTLVDGSVQRPNNQTDWFPQTNLDLYLRLEDAPANVPAPGSLMMLVLGLGLLGRLSLRSNRARHTAS